MRIFRLNDTFSIVCQQLPTRTAFKHVATVCINGSATAIETKICYQNRTWERFEFESVLEKVLGMISKNWDVTDEEKKKLLDNNR